MVLTVTLMTFLVAFHKLPYWFHTSVKFFFLEIGDLDIASYAVTLSLQNMRGIEKTQKL